VRKAIFQVPHKEKGEGKSGDGKKGLALDFILSGVFHELTGRVW